MITDSEVATTPGGLESAWTRRTSVSESESDQSLELASELQGKLRFRDGHGTGIMIMKPQPIYQSTNLKEFETTLRPQCHITDLGAARQSLNWQTNALPGGRAAWWSESLPVRCPSRAQ